MDLALPLIDNHAGNEITILCFTVMNFIFTVISLSARTGTLSCPRAFVCLAYLVGRRCRLGSAAFQQEQLAARGSSAFGSIKARSVHVLQRAGEGPKFSRVSARTRSSNCQTLSLARSSERRPPKI